MTTQLSEDAGEPESPAALRSWMTIGQVGRGLHSCKPYGQPLLQL